MKELLLVRKHPAIKELAPVHQAILDAVRITINPGINMNTYSEYFNMVREQLSVAIGEIDKIALKKAKQGK